MNKSVMRTMLILSVVLLTVSFASSGMSNLSSALRGLCAGIRNLIPIVAFLMIVAAGVVYAAGQMLGAETRARASVWATAMLIGAIIGLLIVVVTPSVLSALYAGTYSC